MMGSRAEVSPTPFSRMFFEDERRSNEGLPQGDMEDVIKDDKRAKDLSEFWSKVCRDNLVKIKYITEK